MKSAAPVAEQAKARIDFRCLTQDCTGVVEFNLREIADKDFQAVCPVCHRAYALDAALQDKLERMMKLIEALRNSEDILGDSVVSVNVAGGEVRVPYALLLTRLNTLITLNLGGTPTDFHL
ncbi:MAG: hypothetical protein J6S54_00925, partial [Lentisphaeria bacterium]|nr:hypothetical protein [Lentisphaeria bacterium]